jgi:hypothetical protein
MADNLDGYYNQHQMKANTKARNRLEQMTLLDIDSPPLQIRHTGIICTIGKYFTLLYTINMIYFKHHPFYTFKLNSRPSMWICTKIS